MDQHRTGLYGKNEKMAQWLEEATATRFETMSSPGHRASDQRLVILADNSAAQRARGAMTLDAV